MPKTERFSNAERENIRTAISHLLEARRAIQGDELMRDEIVRIWERIVTARQELQAILNER